jgi:hypothetical protein
MSRTIKRAMAIAAVGAAAALAPATAGATTTTTTTTAPGGTLTFVPPKVGQIVVVIGPVIIDGKVISPGVHVENPVTQIPTMTITLPTFPTLPGWPPHTS